MSNAKRSQTTTCSLLKVSERIKMNRRKDNDNKLLKKMKRTTKWRTNKGKAVSLKSRLKKFGCFVGFDKDPHPSAIAEAPFEFKFHGRAYMLTS